MKFRVGRSNLECTAQRGAWWNSAQPGIGFGFEGSLETETFFERLSHCPLHAVWSTYNAQGRPTWYFSGLFEINPQRPLAYPDRADNYAGPLYQVRGSYFGAPYQASQVVVGAPLGEWRLVRGVSPGDLVVTLRKNTDTYQTVLRRFDY